MHKTEVAHGIESTNAHGDSLFLKMPPPQPYLTLTHLKFKCHFFLEMAFLSKGSKLWSCLPTIHCHLLLFVEVFTSQRIAIPKILGINPEKLKPTNHCNPWTCDSVLTNGR
jgi:hypothetical protein